MCIMGGAGSADCSRGAGGRGAAGGGVGEFEGRGVGQRDEQGARWRHCWSDTHLAQRTNTDRWPHMQSPVRFTCLHPDAPHQGARVGQGTTWLWHYMRLHGTVNALCIKSHIMPPLGGTPPRPPPRPFHQEAGVGVRRAQRGVEHLHRIVGGATPGGGLGGDDARVPAPHSERGLVVVVRVWWWRWGGGAWGSSRASADRWMVCRVGAERGTRK